MTEVAIKTFFDSTTGTFTHVVHDPATRKAAIIDPVWDYDPKSGRTTECSLRSVVDHIASEDLRPEWVLETHVHADHLSAGNLLRERYGCKIGIGAAIRQVQETFKKIFHPEEGFQTDGSQFDRTFADGDAFSIGNVQVSVLHVPGHTPADSAYVIGKHVFVGDTIFAPDVGTARCDFPNGNAHTLYRSIQRLLSMPEDTVLHLCHDYPPEGREPRAEWTVAEERAGNIHVHDGVSEEDFVKMRTERDATLAMPVLILPSVQINMRAGALPPAEANGVSYLKIPVNLL
ncbi:MBL fold metallo-hydrolase [Acidithiobacillus sp. AMEEHan]|uniref:MBL fold metallo-hydrolase n=1 Tax=Acidithiobacillus sp. AMEEHan TaxID=2994951 RepID=UPI0027E5B611|nr:MBL fold metallo-hydrolase [Acidithiobacillus sp. AMEEHan]